MIKTKNLPANYGAASIIGILMGIACFWTISTSLWTIPWPVELMEYRYHLKGWLALRGEFLLPTWLGELATDYRYTLAHLQAGMPSWVLTGRFDLALLLAILPVAWVTWLLGKPEPDTLITAGRTLYQGKEAHQHLACVARQEAAVSGEGLKLHPSFGWSLSRDRETRHILTIGSVGSGKTQIILPLAQSAISRGDKCVVYDTKGDFTQTLGVPFVLLAPWDERSAAWDIAADCSNAADARELAARIIPEGHDPLWHQAARQVMTAIILELQDTKPANWNWQDLFAACCRDQGTMQKTVARYLPEAKSLLAENSKTTQSILINFSASLAVIADLAKAWGEVPAERRFSFSRWLKANNPKRKVVIIQGSGRYQELARGFTQSVVSMLAGRINSAEFTDDSKRRLWLFLDEFPQLGKLNHFGSILEVGRSKGVCVVLGAQDMAQIQELYGPHVGKAWSSLVGTQIITRVNAGETAQFIAKEMVGYATLEKTIIRDGKTEPPITQQQLVLEASDLSDHLGSTKQGVKAVILGMGDAYVVTWPYTTLKKVREASVPATWLRASQPKSEASSAEDQKERHGGEGNQINEANQQAGKMTADRNVKAPRLKLRSKNDLEAMAVTGTDLAEAGEPSEDMQANATEGVVA